MNVKQTWTSIAAAAAVVALSACAGESNERTIGPADDDRQAAADRAPDDRPSITVAGCLQRGDGGAFLLTRVNEPTQSVGTSGSGSSTAQREQMRAAAGTYRVEPGDDMKLENLVGKEVSVTGTVTDHADLPRANTGNDRIKVDEDDVTRIAAASVTAVREVCQGAESNAPASSTSPGGRR